MEENLKQSIKYIVYLTVCKKNKKIYVGEHETSTPYKFDGYLGDGVYINKPSSYKGKRSDGSVFYKAVNKYGPDQFVRVTLKVFDTLKEALAEEARIVTPEFIKRPDTYNITVGGGAPPIKTTEIHQYDTDGNYIASYSSIKEAGEKLKIYCGRISYVAKTKGITHGYMWSYEKVDKLNPYIDKTQARKVGVYKDGVLIAEYPTIIACKKDYCGCVHVLYGTRKTCKGCTFKFIE